MAAVVAVIASMAVVNDEGTRSYLIAVVLAAAFIRGRVERGRGERTAEPAGQRRAAAEV